MTKTKHVEADFEGVDLTDAPEWAQTPHARRLLAAFRRLCDNRPLQLPKGAAVSQNNVAKEAGLHSTALKKNRYPELIQMIKEYKAQMPAKKVPTKRDRLQAKSATVITLKQELERVQKERDDAQSKLTTLMLEMIYLRRSLARAEGQSETEVLRGESNVTPIDSKQK